METPDFQLLHDYLQDGCRPAFAELASRHTEWVYSMALRLVRNRQLAEDVTQGVFLALAQNANRLRGPTIGGWLFKATRYVASTALRAESRRQKHERQAAMMRATIMQPETGQDWQTDVAPQLEQFVAALRKSERQAVLLRFYQGKSLADVGSALGVSEDAARKRLARAVDKLRDSYRMAGVSFSAVALLSLLASNTTHAAPIPLVASCGSLSGSSVAHSLAQGVSKMILRSNIKTAAMAGLVLAVMASSLAAILLAQVSSGPTNPSPAAASTQPAAVAQVTPTTAPAVTSENQQMESWWADLAESDPQSDRALLHFAATPEKTVAFLQTKMLPLTITPERLRGLIVRLGSSDEAEWKPAFDELSYFDPRLAIDLQTLMDTVTTNPSRQRLIEVLNGYPPGTLNGMTVTLRQTQPVGPDNRPQYNFFMTRGAAGAPATRGAGPAGSSRGARGARGGGGGGGSVWAESDVSRLGTGPMTNKKFWTRAIRGIVLLDQIGTPDALAIIAQMATGHPDALPTQVAKQTLADRH